MLKRLGQKNFNHRVSNNHWGLAAYRYWVIEMMMTEWEAHQIAAEANRIRLHDRDDWYVSIDKDGDPIVIDSEANWLSRDDLAILARQP